MLIFNKQQKSNYELFLLQQPLNILLQFTRSDKIKNDEFLSYCNKRHDLIQ